MKSTAFYIASRYLIAKKGSTAVTFITWLSALAMTVAVAAMFIIISVFSGLEDLNREMIADLHPDLTLKSSNSKTLADIPQLINTLKATKGIGHFSKMIEEKAYVSYGENGDIATVRGVDSAYTYVNPVDKNIFYGTYPSFKFANEVIMENQLDARLSIPVGSNVDNAVVMMPKPGTGIITKESDIFNKKDIFVTGVFPSNGQLNNTIIAPLELLQQLLQLPKNSCYTIVIKLENPKSADRIKRDLVKKLGGQYIITTKNEENAAFWKMINTEKFFIYLIFGLVIFITTFNLAGAIIILQLDKKEQAKALRSLGFPNHQLRKVYFFTGLLIVFSGIFVGLLVGTLLCIFQIYTGLFEAAPNLPFPVDINGTNYIIVVLTAAFFGIAVSWFFSKINKNNIN